MIYKPVGITPYQLTLKIKEKYPKIKKVAYVYRLDPMAHGEILILTDEECKLTNYYVQLKSYKIYEFSVLFGIKTDTLDILGNILENNICSFDLNLILKNKNYLIGEYFQEFPIFSSKTINYNGKMTPLWKLKNKIKDLDISKKRVNVEYIKYINHKVYSKNQILKLVIQRLNLVTSKNFNTKEFIKKWKLIKNKDYLVVDFVSKVSSGTYIREISNQLGKKCNYNSINLNIFRKNILLL